MEESSRVLRDRVQAILGQLSPKEDKENFPDLSPSKRTLATPVLRASSLKDIIALVDSERGRKSVGSALSVSLRKLDEENESLRSEVELLNLRLVEAEKKFVSRTTELVSKHGRQLASIQAELAGLKAEKERCLSEIERLGEDNAELTAKLTLKLKRDEDRFKSDLGRAKASLVAKDKELRRKWEEDKTAEIKEFVKREAESEIERIMMAHNLEVQVLTERHLEALQAQEQKHISDMETLKEQHRIEREQLALQEQSKCLELLQAEKTINAERETFEKQLDQARNSFTQELVVQRSKTDRLESMYKSELERANAEYKRAAELEVAVEERQKELENTSRELKDAFEMRLAENEGELDRLKLENTLQTHKIQVLERDAEIIKSSDLALLEEKLRDLVDEKNAEIDYLVQRIAFLERRGGER
jgi:hypothetical protein